MTAADPNIGEDGLTVAGREAAADKAAAAAKLNGTAPAIAAADQAAAQTREDQRKATTREKAAAARLAREAAAAEQLAEQAARGPQQAPDAPPAEQPCEPCMQLHRAVSERLDRIETQVQAIGKLVVVGVIGGAIVYFLSSRRPQLALAAGLGRADPAEGGEAAEGEAELAGAA